MMTISSNLASGARRALRAAAHHLDPVVMIGEKGLTASVLHEIDIALTAHALIKVRVASDEREQRIAFMNEICEKLGCESVQHLGKLLVLWRNKEDGSGLPVDDDAEESEDAAPSARARGPRSKLSATKDAGFRRPTEFDPRPRSGSDSRPREAGARKTGGYGRRDASGEGYAPRGAGGSYGRDAERGGSGYARGGESGGYGRNETSGARSRAGDGTRSRSSNTGSENQRYRRSDGAAPADTRAPREGWAPRERRGAGRGTSGDTRGESGGFGRSSSGDGRSGFGSDGFAPAGERRAPRGRTGDGGYAPAGAPRGRTSAGAGRAPTGEGRWGARGGSSTGGGASGAPKPRARRRLG